MAPLTEYMETLRRTVCEAEATGGDGTRLDLADTITSLGEEVRATHDRGNKLMFVGNGGSAGIASHMAIDYSKNGGMRSLAFNDGAALTCLGNDLGYDQVFATQLSLHGQSGDVLIAISSSGRSPNILHAVTAARTRDCRVFTLSGFTPDNPLRSMGDINIYLPSRQYGFVEIGHLAVLHAVLDVQTGWVPQVLEQDRDSRPPLGQDGETFVHHQRVMRAP